MIGLKTYKDKHIQIIDNFDISEKNIIFRCCDNIDKALCDILLYYTTESSLLVVEDIASILTSYIKHCSEVACDQIKTKIKTNKKKYGRKI